LFLSLAKNLPFRQLSLQEIANAEFFSAESSSDLSLFIEEDA